MSSSTAIEPPSPSATTPSSPAIRPSSENYGPFQTSTPNFVGKKQPPLTVVLPNTAPSTPTLYSEPTLTPPPRSPGANTASGNHPPDGTSSDKSSETAVAGITRPPTAPLTRKESYKAQRQHYRREKKRVTSALLHSIDDPSVVVLADFLKGNHWVGTVLLTSCQVIERPSKKDGFCFKLYHPLEQSIWAPRGPHNETIGAVVQPLPTSHLIFRSTSQEQGHCWLDGLEVALRCSNAMLRCSRSRPEQSHPNEDVPNPNISHEELEKHFNEHVVKLPGRNAKPVLSVSDYNSPNISRSESPERKSKGKHKKTSKWAQFMDSLERVSKDYYASSDSLSLAKENKGKYTQGKTLLDRNLPEINSSLDSTNEALTSKDDTKTSAMKLKMSSCQKIPIFKKFELPKLPISTSNLLEDNLFKLVTSLPKRRCSTPMNLSSSLTSKRISELRSSGAKTDSENDDVVLEKGLRFKKMRSERFCKTPVITTTAPSVDLYSNYSSSSTDNVCDRMMCRSETPYNAGRFCLIDYKHMPSSSYEALKIEKRDERFLSQNIRVSGKVVDCGMFLYPK